VRLKQAFLDLFRPRAADPALDERFWVGDVSLSKAGQWVSPASSEQYITLQACVDLFKKAFLMLPPQVLRYTEAGKFEVPGHAAGTILRKSPNPYQKPYQFKALMMHQALLAGNAFAEVREGRDGPEMWPLAPVNVEGPELLPSGRRRYKVKREGFRTDSLLGDMELLHVTGLWLDSSGMRGKSIIDRAREALGLALAADSYGAKLFASGVKYPGILTMPGPLNDPALRGAIADSFKRQSENGYPLLEQGMDFKSMGMTNDDAQFLETRKFSVSEIARLFGVPPHMIGDVERSTSWGAGIEAQTFQFVTYALLPWLTIWQECFEAVLVPEDDVHIRFGVGKLMQADMTSRFGVYKSAIDDGILSPNECRALEDLNPREGGDKYREEPRGNASGAAPMPTKREPMPPDDDEEEAAAAMLSEQDARVKALAALRSSADVLGVPPEQVRKLVAHAKTKGRPADAEARS
jgi:HK97 family phage portal protein